MFRQKRLKRERISSLTLQQTEDNKIKGERRKALLEFIAVGLCGCLFVLVSSSWSSPLFKDAYGYDSSWYSTVGRAVVAGMVPYKDLFDLKGPAFFFYEAFGQLFFSGRNGVFFIQCISGAASAVLMYNIARRLLSRSLAFTALLLFYFPYVYLLWGGNTVEELFMPFNLAAIFMGLKYLEGNEKTRERTAAYALLYGLFAGVFVFSKVTAGAPLYAATLAIVIALIRDKAYDKLARCAVSFIAGLGLISIPVFAYFIMRGAIKDMVHCVFVLGLRRSTDYYISFGYEWERNLLICPASLLLAVLHGRDLSGGVSDGENGFGKSFRALRYLILVSSPVIYILLHLGSAYIYYFITLIPLWGMTVVFCTAVFTEKFKELTGNSWGRIKFTLSICLLACVAALYFNNVRAKTFENLSLLIEQPDKSYVKACEETYSLIPEWERDGLYNIESGFKFYEINHILPENKYCVNIPYFLHLDDGARADFMERLERRSPKWIVTENLENIDIPEFQDYIAQNYTIVAQNDYGYLYRRD